MQSPLTGIVSDEQREVVITADSTGLIKTWQGQTGQEVASFSTGSPHSTLLQYNVDNNWFLTVSDIRLPGFIHLKIVLFSTKIRLSLYYLSDWNQSGICVYTR